MAAGQAAESYLHLRVRQNDKARWVRAARRRKLNLTQFVAGACNGQVALDQYAAGKGG
jgi:uncharacterized protein (DUF1778 family)